MTAITSRGQVMMVREAGYHEQGYECDSKKTTLVWSQEIQLSSEYEYWIQQIKKYVWDFDKGVLNHLRQVSTLQKNISYTINGKKQYSSLVQAYT
ncbi:Protein of unknown function [Gryllus bimaculatus]|nr:Protein of unknown function [Gryllus bimaculatus]